VVNTSPLFSDCAMQIVTLTTHARLPVDGLMSYAASYPGQARQISGYVGRVLKR
jgi:hypothetical protein